ncbi:hypothetical protein ACR6C2_00840 [Streptomyces sp. INA 01156]
MARPSCRPGGDGRARCHPPRNRPAPPGPGEGAPCRTRRCPGPRRTGPRRHLRFRGGNDAPAADGRRPPGPHRPSAAAQRDPPDTPGETGLLPGRPAPPAPHHRPGGHPARCPAPPPAALLPQPRRHPDPRCSRPSPLPDQEHLSPRHLRSILEHTLPVPAAWVTRASARHHPPASWKQHPLLADTVLLPTDSSTRKSEQCFGHHWLRMDEELGLLYRKDH